MIVVERTFAVTAAPGVALGYLQDFENAQEWDRSSVRTTRLGTGPIVPGTRWRHVRKLYGVTAELTYTLISSDPGGLVLHGRSEGATCIDTVFVRAVPGATEVMYRVELELHGLAKLATPLLRPELERLAAAGVAVVTGALGSAVRHRFGAPIAPNRLTAPLEETG
ncbi:SRPBCC family protein [Actinoplanes sp. KI2]|uniref:SRPBCC family protein n=1 Tax=Actinoplanes sp. KI2 TaxID=2983315 RepID=UPI0021D577C9|nr:SRPBCC family protein [Actinoplanes sp. KI2]MCU7729850.1 SRPBCC family protein [Actinoplanes sp. KI2]